MVKCRQQLKELMDRYVQPQKVAIHEGFLKLSHPASIEQPLRLQRNPKGLGPQLASSEAIPKKAEQGRLGSGGGLFGLLVHRSMKQLAPQISQDTALQSRIDQRQIAPT